MPIQQESRDPEDIIVSEPEWILLRQNCLATSK